MTVRLEDFLAALAGCPKDGLVDFVMLDIGSNTEIELHPHSTLGDVERTRFTLFFTKVPKEPAQEKS
jgi:hypothetical protein